MRRDGALSGFPDNEAIILNYDDPFLSNEAKNSLMEENKLKSEKSVRISESSRDNHASSTSIRSELDEVKQILRSTNQSYRDCNPDGGYPRNFRQSGSNRDEFDGRNRYLHDDFRDRASRPLNTNN